MRENSKTKRGLYAKFFAEDIVEEGVKVPWPLRILFAVTGGVFIFLAFPDYYQFYLAWIALALELWAIEGLKAKPAFWVMLLAGTITNVGGFYWLESTLEVFGHFPVWLSWVLCVLLCMAQALIFAFWGALTAYFRNSRWPRLASLAALVAFEWGWPMIFPWHMANSQNNFLPALQIADILGALGVTLLVATINMVVFDATRTLVKRLQKKEAKFCKPFYIGAFLYIAICFIYAPIRMAQVDRLQEEAPKLRVAMIEGDLGVWQIETSEKIKNNLFVHHSLSKQADLKDVDLIIWPESGYQSPYIWGSRLKDVSLTEHELDALYADWFKPQARRIYAFMDEMFGEDFRQMQPVHEAMHRSISAAAQMYKYAPIDLYYTALVNGYGFRCHDEPPYIHKCPYASITPDDIQWYYVSRTPLGEDRKADIAKRVRPYDIAAPIRDTKAAMFFGTLTGNADDTAASLQALYHDRKTKRTIYNAAKLIDSNGNVLGSYHKHFLMPFGEYIPFGDMFPVVYDLVPEAGRLTPGEGPGVMKLGEYTLGPIICYEDIVASFVREVSKLEPNVFLNVTDDAWFGKSSEPYEHLALAALRSVEHRMWLIRSTNTGVSAFVDANGRIVEQTKITDPEYLIADVPMMANGRTIYSYIGDVLGWGSAAFVLLLFIVKVRASKRKKTDKSEGTGTSEVTDKSEVTNTSEVTDKS